jgi:cytochrome c oxidase subunit 2
MMPKAILDLLALPPEGSTISTQIDALHVFVITTTMVSSFIVFAAAAYFVVRYKRKDEGQLTPRVNATVRSEGTIVVGILGLFVLWWVIGFRQYVTMRDPPEGAMTVYVTAKQWMWKFTYPDGRSANDVLTIPTGKPVKLVMTSRDVIHSFYVPGFRTKMDVLPGRYTTEWFEAKAAGEYPIYCAEYCGVSHSMMRGTVVVLTPEDYETWLEKPARDVSGDTDLATRGAEVARRRECLACHTVTGERHIGPTWAGLYGSWQSMSDGRRVLADEAYLTRSMMEPGAEVVDTYKNVMPSYFAVLPQPEAAALVEYIKSLRDVHPVSGVALPTLESTPKEVADAGAAGTGVPILPEAQ